MALPTATPAPPPSPQVVGAAFVQQYYLVLHRSPELVHRFYQDSSILSRPDADGVMTSVTTMQAINDKLLSFNFSSYIAEIETADSQASHKDGVFIVVTGCLTGSDSIRRKFTQSFFLAPQDNGGYFVLNDIFRFVDRSQPKDLNQILPNGISDDAPKASQTSEPVPSDQNLVQENHVEDLATPPSEGEPDDGEEVYNPSENGGSEVEEEVVLDPPVDPSQADEKPSLEASASVVQEDGPKKSYASIVKVMKGNTPSTPVYVPTTKAKAAPPNPEKPVSVSPTPPPAPATTVSPNKNDVSENNNSSEAEGHSIYVRNLPLNATAEQVEEEFKKFGPIKPGGVQVRNHKVDRFCFGFVEFESLSSMQAAIEASPIALGGRQVYAEEKRTTTRVVNGVVTHSNNGRGRFQPGRGGFRNDNFRGRGGGFMGNNQGYGRTEFRSRGEFSGRGRGRGPPGHAGLQNGYGRMGRANGMNQTAVSA